MHLAHFNGCASRVPGSKVTSSQNTTNTMLKYKMVMNNIIGEKDKLSYAAIACKRLEELTVIGNTDESTRNLIIIAYHGQ